MSKSADWKMNAFLDALNNAVYEYGQEKSAFIISEESIREFLGKIPENFDEKVTEYFRGSDYYGLPIEIYGGKWSILCFQYDYFSEIETLHLFSDKQIEICAKSVLEKLSKDEISALETYFLSREEKD